MTMKMTKTIFAITLSLWISVCLPLKAQPVQKAMQFDKKITQEVKMKYLLYLPADYADDGSRSFPLMLFLHGSGERGDDLQLVKKHGPPKVAVKMNLPFIILSPQCPASEPWWNIEDVKVLLDDIISRYPVDRDRIYITGLSMGGFATWDMIIKYPDVFAAAAPVCGGGYTHRAHLIKDVPVWAFHGQKDNVVPIAYSQQMVNALIDNGAEVEFTVYPDAGHDAWTPTYNNPELYEWLLSHTKNKED